MSKSRTKIATMCQYGHSRSVAMARALHSYNIEAVAFGSGTAPSIGGSMLDSVDAVIIMDLALVPWFIQMYPEQLSKALVMHVGQDQWQNPYHPDLAQLCHMMLYVAALLPVSIVAWDEGRTQRYQRSFMNAGADHPKVFRTAVLDRMYNSALWLDPEVREKMYAKVQPGTVQTSNYDILREIEFLQDPRQLLPTAADFQ